MHLRLPSGGTVAVEMTRRHPELVHALVLGEPAVGFFGEGATRDTAIARAAMTTSGLDSTRARFIRGDSLGGMKALVDASGGDWDASLPDLERYFLSQLLELRKEMTDPSEVSIPPTTCADLRLLTMPVLLVEDERMIAVHHGIDQQIAGCLKGAKTVIVPGVDGLPCRPSHTGARGSGDPKLQWRRLAAYHDCLIGVMPPQSSAERPLVGAPPCYASQLDAQQTYGLCYWRRRECPVWLSSRRVSRA